jgi:hypothetical protein
VAVDPCGMSPVLCTHVPTRLSDEFDAVMPYLPGLLGRDRPGSLRALRYGPLLGDGTRPQRPPEHLPLPSGRMGRALSRRGRVHRIRLAHPARAARSQPALHRGGVGRRPTLVGHARRSARMNGT